VILDRDTIAQRAASKKAAGLHRPLLRLPVQMNLRGFYLQTFYGTLTDWLVLLVAPSLSFTVNFTV